MTPDVVLISTVVMTVVMLPVMHLEGFFGAVSSFMIALLVRVVTTEWESKWESLTNGPYGLSVLGAPEVGGLSAVARYRLYAFARRQRERDDTAPVTGR